MWECQLCIDIYLDNVDVKKLITEYEGELEQTKGLPIAKLSIKKKENVLRI